MSSRRDARRGTVRGVAPVYRVLPLSTALFGAVRNPGRINTDAHTALIVRLPEAA